MARTDKPLASELYRHRAVRIAPFHSVLIGRKWAIIKEGR